MAAGGLMERYRYRTAALVGPWRALPDQAIDDAIRAGQALRESDGRLSWRVTGSIEEGAGETPVDASR
jgi:hypothetical protein